MPAETRERTSSRMTLVGMRLPVENRSSSEPVSGARVAPFTPDAAMASSSSGPIMPDLREGGATFRPRSRMQAKMAGAWGWLFSEVLTRPTLSRCLAASSSTAERFASGTLRYGA
jgi:hypothetical protein